MAFSVPWVPLLRQSPNICHDATFVDVDYPQLVEEKCKIILQNKELSDLLPKPIEAQRIGTIPLRTRNYVAVACDLSHVEELAAILKDVIVDHGSVLFTAEVSIAYMKNEAANAVFAWASIYRNAHFCTLEQFLPDGEDDPFANTMLKHFRKLQSPLRSVQQHPSLDSQHQRFYTNGWSSVNVRDLWSLWCDSDFVKVDERVHLNSIEPFDEWEDFALFASHYFLLVATNSQTREEGTAICGFSDASSRTRDDLEAKRLDAEVRFAHHENLTGLGRRRFAAPFQVAGSVVNHGGTGTIGRLGTVDSFSRGKDSSRVAEGDRQILTRMCHSISAVDGNTVLLAGGRTSPEHARSDSWLYQSDTKVWKKVGSLPCGRFRHCATSISAGKVLLFGGKTSDGSILDDWLVWSRENGWQEVITREPAPRKRFGADMIVTGPDYGILVGGMAEDGSILAEYWEWQFGKDEGAANISFRDRSQEILRLPGGFDFCCRFGARLSPSAWGTMIIGGVIGGTPLIREKETLVIDTSTLDIFKLRDLPDGPRPLLVGHSVLSIDNEVLILGGGAVCFSFGSHWNDGIWTISSGKDPANKWHLLTNTTPQTEHPLPVRHVDTKSSTTTQEPSDIIPVETVTISSVEDFRNIVDAGKPVIIAGLDIGSCTSKWQDVSYIADKAGADRIVSVHASTSTHMSFTPTKNFTYERMRFDDFLRGANSGSKLYLRSLSAAGPSTTPTTLAADFPNLAVDFSLPPVLASVTDTMHSSPLRISGPVSMWLHYDVMANILFQIRTTKTIHLYPPSSASALGFSPASTTSAVQPLLTPPPPALAHVPTYIATLQPGAGLFIPALWPHTVAAPDVDAGASVSVNVFFRHLHHSRYAPGRDVYGNREIVAYERARADVDRLARRFDGLPVDIRRFYAERLAAEVRDKVGGGGEGSS
ncbi:MAG: hypothetical protein M1825_000376 [Sarcosagium campestre]|nr:MAG: hypothetical protein M1825_000376 [Sarcosagium campestre]